MSVRALKLLVLGRGKTGALVADVARERGHSVEAIDENVNQNASWLSAEHLGDIDVALDFTAPDAVIANIDACVRAGKAMVVGTTGWYGGIDRVRAAVKQAGTGFVYGANFSYGVNLFYQILRAAAPALEHGYSSQITEIHHIQKKDAPSGTAATMQRILQEAAGIGVDIRSERVGEVPGTHTLELNSAGDRMVLTHEVKSRRTFAEGAVLAAEWIAARQGFYEFKDIFAQV